MENIFRNDELIEYRNNFVELDAELKARESVRLMITLEFR